MQFGALLHGAFPWSQGQWGCSMARALQLACSHRVAPSSTRRRGKLQQRKSHTGNYSNTFCTVQLSARPGLALCCRGSSQAPCPAGAQEQALPCCALEKSARPRGSSWLQQRRGAPTPPCMNQAGALASVGWGFCSAARRASSGAEGSPQHHGASGPGAAEHGPRSSGATQGLTGSSPTLLSLVRNIAQSQG